MKRNQQRGIASALLGGPLTPEEVARDYVRRNEDKHDQYLLILPSGARALLIVPSPLAGEDRAILQKILDLIPPA